MELPDWIPWNHPSRAVLAKLAGKRRHNVDFKLLDRKYCSREVLVWEELLKTTLIGVGVEDSGHGEFYIATGGRCFGCSCMHDAFYFHGRTQRWWFIRKMLGMHARPMLRTDQKSVMLYGQTFHQGSRQIYTS